MNSALIAGTRRSRLAQIQTEQVLSNLRDAWPRLQSRTEYIVTEGDRTLGSLRTADKGAFTGALEEALLAGRIDIAVHSLKDLPVELPKGLMLGAIADRSTARDACVSASGWAPEEMPLGAVVGTSSVRRAAQLCAWRSDLRITPLRGNVDTRLRRMLSGDVDAVILAEAGLRRLRVQEIPYALIALEVMLPAPGQGALAVECRAADKDTRQLLNAIDSPGDRRATSAERSFLKAVGGGCGAPIAAYARPEGDTLAMDAVVLARDGSKQVRVSGHGNSAAELGNALAQMALSRGAIELMQDA